MFSRNWLKLIWHKPISSIFISVGFGLWQFAQVDIPWQIISKQAETVEVLFPRWIIFILGMCQVSLSLQIPTRGKRARTWALSLTCHYVILGCRRNVFRVPWNAPILEEEFWNICCSSFWVAHLLLQIIYQKLICERKLSCRDVNVWLGMNPQSLLLLLSLTSMSHHLAVNDSPGKFYNFPLIYSLGFSPSFRMILQETDPDVTGRGRR